MIRLVLAAAAVVAGAPAESPQIKAYLRDQMHLYNEDGSYKGVAPRDSLPKAALLFFVSADDAHIKTKDSKGTVYIFRAAELLTENASSKCRPLAAINRPADRHLAAGDVGVSSGLSTSAVPCLK